MRRTSGYVFPGVLWLLPPLAWVCVLVFYWFSVSGFCALLLLLAFCFLKHCVIFWQMCEIEVIPGSSLRQTSAPCCSRWRLRCHTVTLWLRHEKQTFFFPKHLLQLRILRTACCTSLCYNLVITEMIVETVWWSPLNDLRGNWTFCSSRKEMRGVLRTQNTQNTFEEPQ